MLERKIMNKLLLWKQRNTKKALIISGARQTGKTFIVRQFGRENYTSIIELNFLEDKNLCDIFSGDLHPKSIYTNISLMCPGCTLIPHETLLFLDEIQACPNAISALKFLVEDGNADVIATGSALGIAFGNTASFPVGSVEYLDMYSLSFEEYLHAIGIDSSVIDYLRDCFENRTPVASPVHKKMLEYLKQYIAVGGMPEVVNTFVQTGSYAEADKIQRQLYKDYITDIAHYASPDIRIKAENCYKSIPLQLTKENHKFQYTIVEKKGTARKFESSVDWMENAFTAYPVYNVSAISFPLKAFAKSDNFRLYYNDIGMLTAAYDYSLKKALIDDQPDESSPVPMLKIAKGGIYEALAADLLIKNGHKELFFFRNETGSLEIEFLLEKTSGIIPIEIKAGRNSTASLDNILKMEDIPEGYKFCAQNIGVSGKKVTMPLYMLMFL